MKVIRVFRVSKGLSHAIIMLFENHLMNDVARIFLMSISKWSYTINEWMDKFSFESIKSNDSIVTCSTFIAVCTILIRHVAFFVTTICIAVFGIRSVSSIFFFYKHLNCFFRWCRLILEINFYHTIDSQQFDRYPNPNFHHQKCGAMKAWAIREKNHQSE